MTRLLILLFLTFPVIAFAANPPLPWDLEVCWTNPTQNEDGTTLTDLAQIRIEYYRSNDTVPSFVANVPDTGEGTRQCELFDGSVDQVGTYDVIGYAINGGGLESQASVPLTVKMIPPKAPTDLGRN